MRLLAYLFLTFSSLSCLAQQTKPENWQDIIRQSWYYGIVNGKPAFAWLDENDPSANYFFVADKAIPQINELNIKWKLGDPRSIRFKHNGRKIKAKFLGSVNNDTIAGIMSLSRKNAIRLNAPPELSIFMAKENPYLPAPMPPRYLSPIFPGVSVLEEISYGAASGYYVSMPVETEGYDYQQIILDAMEKMYVNPAKEAIVHLLNKNPVSFALTDLQPLRLDIYQPTGDTLKNRPLIVLLHGGAFILGDKATPTIQELANDFASKGYVVAAINYRIGFNIGSKSSLERSAYRAVQDARAALRFLSANAETYRLDPNCVLLGGSSAGAITALNAAFMKDEERPESSRRNLWRAQPDLGGLDESTNNFQGEYTIRTVVNLWGALSDTNIIDSYENIPVLSIHGDADKIVPYNFAYPFSEIDTSLTSNIVTKLYGSFPVHKRLTSLGIHSELVTLRNAGHEPQYEPGKYQMVMDTILTRTTDFYFRSLFSFPEVNGPRQVAIGTLPSTYIVPAREELTCYWKATGGKIIPGSEKNIARVVWLADGEGTVSLVMVHRNGATVEVRIPVELPE